MNQTSTISQPVYGIGLGSALSVTIEVVAFAVSLLISDLGFNNFGFLGDSVVSLIIRAYGLVGTSAEQGAQTSIYPATSGTVKGVTGKYFEKQESVPSSPASYDEAAAKRLWRVSAEMTGLPVSAD